MLNIGQRATMLRQRLQIGEITVAPGAFDGVSAQVLAQAGFEAIFLSGYGLSVSKLGIADVGVMSFAEVYERSRDIISSVSIPVIADADTGYGGPHNIRRTVQSLEQVGAAALILEDQEWPKRCGHLHGKRVIPKEEMVQKLRAAVDARQGDLVIIGRTDAVQPNGLEDAMDRARAFYAAGADVVFIEGLGDAAEMRYVTSTLQLPMLANMIEGSITAYLKPHELQAMGFVIALWPLTLLLSAITYMQHIAAEMKTHGTITPATFEQTMQFPAFTTFWGVDQLDNIAARYVPETETTQS